MTRNYFFSLLAPISFVYLHNIFGLKAKDNNGFRDPAMKTPFAVLNPGALELPFTTAVGNHFTYNLFHGRFRRDHVMAGIAGLCVLR